MSQSVYIHGLHSVARALWCLFWLELLEFLWR